MDIMEAYPDKVVPVTETGCWLWLGCLNGSGYGNISKKWLAHRKSYRLSFGPIPVGISVLHTCDIKICVNPAHLFLGTAADNHLDMVKKQRSTSPLSEADVRDILDSKENDSVTARKYGVTHTCIWQIRNGVSWRHLRA